MTLLAASGLTPGLLLKIVVAAWAAGIGVTLAFSALIYCADRAGAYHRSGRRGAAWAFSGVSALAGLACLALVVIGLIEVTTKS